MDLDTYINRLTSVANNYNGYVSKLLKSRKGYVLAIPKQRFYQYGTDANDERIFPVGKTYSVYAPSYVKKKRRRGKRTSHVTLNYSGKLWDSFKLIDTQKGIDFTVPSTKATKFLEGHYSSNKLFGFSPSDEEKIFQLFIKPELENLINPKEDIKIKF